MCDVSVHVRFLKKKKARITFLKYTLYQQAFASCACFDELWGKVPVLPLPDVLAPCAVLPDSDNSIAPWHPLQWHLFTVLTCIRHISCLQLLNQWFWYATLKFGYARYSNEIGCRNIMQHFLPKDDALICNVCYCQCSVAAALATFLWNAYSMSSKYTAHHLTDVDNGCLNNAIIQGNRVSCTLMTVFVYSSWFSLS